MKTKNQKEKYQKTKINVHGMTCNTCKNKIENQLEKNPKRITAKANLKENHVIITHQTNLDLQEITKNIQELGYKTKKEKATKQGLLYGLIPHAGCIAFIIASIIGATFFMNLFRPLLMNSYFFYALIAISIIFATISATIYLKKNKLLSLQGIKRQKKYLATLYGTTIIINLVLFLLIFPLTANLASAKTSTATEDSMTLNLNIIIPCSGHAALIINELNQEEGIQEVKYTFPYEFVVKYDAQQTNETKILKAEIFTEFPATTN